MRDPAWPGVPGLLLLGLLIWAGLSLLWTDRPDKSPDFWLTLSMVTAVTVIGLEASRNPLASVPRRRLFWTFMVVHGIVAGWVAFTLVSDMMVFHLFATLGLVEPEIDKSLLNRSLTFLVLTLWPLLGWLALRRSVRAIVVVAGLTGLALFFGASDAARLAMVVAAAMGGFALLATPGLLRWSLRGMAVAVILVSPWLLTQVVAPVVAQDRQSLGWMTDSGLHRLEIISLYAYPMATRPVTGWGLATATTVPRQPPEDADEQTRARWALDPDAFIWSDPRDMTVHPHNNFVQVWTDLGLVGIGILTALGWWAAGRIACMPAPTMRAAGSATMGAVLVVASIAYGSWQVDWLAQILFAVLMIRLLPPPREPPPRVGEEDGPGAPVGALP